MAGTNRRWLGPARGALAAGMLIAAVWAPGASAATFTVTKTTDEAGACNVGDCALREAVTAANAVATDDVITLPAGTYTLSLVNPGNVTENANTTGDLDVLPAMGSLAIEGAGSGTTTISGNGTDRILHVLADTVTFRTTTLELDGVTLTNGDPRANTDAADRNGGAIRNDDSRVALDRVSVTGNFAEEGGAVFGGGPNAGNNPTLWAIDSAINANHATSGSAGAVYNMHDGRFVAIRTTINDNDAFGSGGAIYNDDDSTFTLIEGELRGNSTPSTAGAIYDNNHSSTSIMDSTVSGNTSGSSAGVLYANNESSATFVRVTFDQNTARRGGTMYLQNESQTTFSDSTVTNSKALDGDGGAFYIQNEAVSVFDDTTISGATASELGGGMIVRNRAQTIVRDSTISGNQAMAPGPGEGGGGIQVGDGDEEASLTLIGSTVSGNIATGDGGGISLNGLNGHNRVLIENSTLSGNTAARGGGIHAVQPGNSISLRNATIAANTATGAGGAIFNDAAAAAGIELDRTIVAANTGAPSQCSGLVTSLGFNLDSGADCGLAAGGDLQNANADLGPLADNGGPTQTHALGTDSAAINAAGATCSLATDQRGDPRPKDGACDIGAFEADPDTTDPVLTIKVVKTKDVEKLAAVITSDEDATLQIAGKAKPPKIPATSGGAGSAAKKLKLPFVPKAVTALAGVAKKVKLKLSKKNRRKVSRALAKKSVEKVDAFVKVTATDAAGNSVTEKKNLKIREKKN